MREVDQTVFVATHREGDDEDVELPALRFADAVDLEVLHRSFGPRIEADR